MDRSKLILLIHTVKYLRLKQIYYQLYYLIRNRFFKRNYTKQLKKEILPLNWNDSFLYPNSFTKENKFIFLNLPYQFTDKIDWNYANFGKLWTYNLNYFDFLNQKDCSVNEGLALINDYIKNEINLKDGKEPYPISLRGINWIKFLSKNKTSNVDIDQTLYNHYETLIHNLEYHLLGNHLLENGYSLLFGAYYFKDEILYKKSKQILKQELTEQILDDGAHFELSPMYHQILLHRLLDCINLVQNNFWKEDNLLLFLKKKAIQMTSWLEEVTYQNGSIPMVNDSTYDISPTSGQLFEYAKRLNLHWNKGNLMDSGYRMFRNNNYELFVDVGNIGPDYQPGHAHSDTFSFELYVKNKPILVDPGISTYEKNDRRLKERGTKYHNTVKIGNQDQTQVWDGFRVAKRARIVNQQEKENILEATHDGYKNFGITHTRRFLSNDYKILINDIISKEINKEQIAFFHFHPDIKELEISNTQVYLPKENIDIKFDKELLKIEEENYEYALGFNKRETAKKIKVYFKTTLSTTISI
ncbi:alginate lyase family protein [Aquimarina megaterium]|uniref:alginate lyase family protein n=1 Tax=Aquimarina megaterium TaxID=1443666 RepID=UPI00046FED3F|nr:alginate lyase family protein [Aquimarina megaterium]